MRPPTAAGLASAPGDDTVRDRERPSAAPLLRARALPAWPFAGLFVLYPVWWLLGITPVILPLLGAVCLFLMALRGSIRLPPLWWLWTGFVIWMTASAVMVDTPGRMIGFAQRLGAVIGATLLVVYVYNARERLPRRRALAAMATFGIWLVIGGYLGMLLPYERITTPAMMLTPPTLASNEYVVELLSPRFAEVQHPYGATSDFVRPSAPFPYTNAWGHTFVLLLPVVLALAVRSTRRVRLLLTVGVILAVPPALATLNRGIFVGIGVGAAYLTLRYLRRISLVRILQIALALAVLGVGVFASGALDRVTERTSTSSTTQDRASLYQEAFHRTLESPWLGWGAPRPSATLEVSVGTQGHFWYLMFSHGFVGLALYVGTVWGLGLITARYTRRLVDHESMLMHTVIVLIGVTLLFYGVDGLHLVIALSCAALVVRPELNGPTNRTLRASARLHSAVPAPHTLLGNPSGEKGEVDGHRRAQQ
ncbi:MAG: O-antigen ligase family protein [Kineosporiaceae bacterium]|nr:O-antigen ligase family protein [Kineosporiaceae bacterium]